MTDDYSSGYFKAILDIFNILSMSLDDTSWKSKKKYKTLVITFLSCLLANPSLREDMMKYGASIDYFDTQLIITPEGEVKLK